MEELNSKTITASKKYKKKYDNLIKLINGYEKFS